MTMLYPWLDKFATSTAKICSQDKIPHAWMIAAEYGLGGFEFAQYFAKMLLCSSFSHKLCGICNTCINGLVANVDYKEYADKISVDDIRSIIEFTEIAAHNKRKVVVLNNIEDISISAVNALLKVLEEPSCDCIFIVVTSNAANVLPTIFSRVAVININEPCPDVTRDWLQTSLSTKELNTSEKDYLSQLLVYAPLIANDWIESGFWQHFRTILAPFCSRSYSNMQKAGTIFDKYPQQSLYLLCSWVTIFCCNNKQQAVSQSKLFSPLYKLVSKIKLSQLLEFATKLEQCRQALTKTPGLNKTLMFEALYYAWPEPK